MMTRTRLPKEALYRARGCLLGQLAGDALGSLVELQAPEDILERYPDGVRELADGGAWNTLAGQPTDDSEMALALARSLAQHQTYDPERARQAYADWLDSGPFDCGTTVAAGLTGKPKLHSQTNGALMRISPLGIFGAAHTEEQVADWARQDARLTHPHPVCQEINALFAVAIAHAVRTGSTAKALYQNVGSWAQAMQASKPVLQTISDAALGPPSDFLTQQGWVLNAFQNALWQLLHAPNLEEALVDTAMRGGDTDTNAAICGALLGAVHGQAAIPARWTQTILACRPTADRPEVRRPRPQHYWPTDALSLAEELLGR